MSLEVGLFRARRGVISLSFFVQGMIFATWASRIPDIKNSLSLSETTLGGVLFALPAGQLLATAFSAWAVSRFGSRAMLRVAAVIYPMVLIPIAYSDSTLQLTLSLLLFGLCSNLYNISVNTQGVNLERISGRNIMASFHGLWSLGSFSGALLCMLLVWAQLSLFDHFLIVTIFAIVINAIFARWLIATDQKAVSTESSQEATSGGVMAIIRKFDPYILFLGFLGFAAMLCEGAMFDWSGVYFVQVVDVPQSYIRLGYITCMSSMTICRFVADKLIARYSNRLVMQCSGLLIAVGLLISVTWPTLAFATLGFGIVGFGISSLVPICYSLAGRSTIMSPSAALATVTTIGYFGFLIGPPLIGFVAGAITLRWTFALVAVVGATIALFSSRLRG